MDNQDNRVTVNLVLANQVSQDKVTTSMKIKINTTRADHKVTATSCVARKKIAVDTAVIQAADLVDQAAEMNMEAADTARDNLTDVVQTRIVTAVIIVADSNHRVVAASSHGAAAEATTKWKTVSATREMKITEADMVPRIPMTTITSAAAATAGIISATKAAARILAPVVQATAVQGMVSKEATAMKALLTEAAETRATDTATIVTTTNHLMDVEEAMKADTKTPDPVVAAMSATAVMARAKTTIMVPANQAADHLQVVAEEKRATVN